MIVNLRKNENRYKKDFPLGRYSHSSIIYKNKIYIFGGRLPDFASRLNSTWCYDIELQNWKEVCTKIKPSPVFGHTCFLYDGNMITFGGVTSLYTYSNTLHSFNLETDEWNLIESNETLISRRAFHSGVIVGKDIYIFGGENDFGNLNDFFKFDLKTFEWKKIETDTSHIHPRVEHACMYYNNSIIVYGGTRNGESFFGDIHSYNITTGLWKNFESNRGPSRSGITISHYKDRMFVVGGYDGKERGDLWIYDFKSETWRQCSDRMLPERSFYSLSKYNDSFFIFGGHNQEINEVYDEMIELELKDSLKINDFVNFIDLTFEYLSEENSRKRKIDQLD